MLLRSPQDVGSGFILSCPICFPAGSKQAPIRAPEKPKPGREPPATPWQGLH